MTQIFNISVTSREILNVHYNEYTYCTYIYIYILFTSAQSTIFFNSDMLISFVLFLQPEIMKFATFSLLN